MSDESSNISSKTWCRTVEPVVKAGYMNGASHGQDASFQSSFDKGYSQGLRFGLCLGYIEGVQRAKNEENIPFEMALNDTRRINCQLCLNGNMIQDKIDNLYNFQEEKNVEYKSSKK